MKRVASVVFGFFLLGVSVVRADEKLPDSMPTDVAQELDYALYSESRVAREVLEKYQKQAEEEIKRRTKKQQDKIDEISKRWKLKLADDKGQPLDKVDPETGKITRKAVPAPAKK